MVVIDKDQTKLRAALQITFWYRAFTDLSRLYWNMEWLIEEHLVKNNHNILPLLQTAGILIADDVKP